MNILWMGGEDIDFPNGNTIAADTTAGRFRSGYARCGLSTSGTYSGSTPFKGGAVTACWLSAYIQTNSSTSNTACVGLIQSGQSYKGIYIGTVNGNTICVSVYNGSWSTLVTTSTILTQNGAPVKVDLQIVSFSATAVTLNLYVSGSLAGTYTGNPSLTGLTGFDSVSVAALSGTFNCHVSEIIVADADTRSLSLVSMAPNGNGTTQAWANPAYTNFNPISINDANTTYSNTIGQDEQAALIDPPAGTFQVLAVKIAARAMASTGAVSTNLSLGVNSGGTVAVNAAHTLSAAFTTYEDYFTNDPTTSAHFTQASLTALQLNLRSA